eukprot:569190-Amphidinium_carterae.3
MAAALLNTRKKALTGKDRLWKLDADFITAVWGDGMAEKNAWVAGSLPTSADWLSVTTAHEFSEKFMNSGVFEWAAAAVKGEIKSAHKWLADLLH